MGTQALVHGSHGSFESKRGAFNAAAWRRYSLLPGRNGREVARRICDHSRSGRWQRLPKKFLRLGRMKTGNGLWAAALSGSMEQAR